MWKKVYFGNILRCILFIYFVLNGKDNNESAKRSQLTIEKSALKSSFKRAIENKILLLLLLLWKFYMQFKNINLKFRPTYVFARFHQSRQIVKRKSVCVCVCVWCVYVCVYIYMYICVYICVYIYVYICVYTYICVYIHTCMCIYIYVCVCIHVCIYVYVCIYIYIYMCVCVCMYVCMYIYIYVCVCVCVYVCVCIYIYIYIYIYICMCVCVCMCIYIFNIITIMSQCKASQLWMELLYAIQKHKWPKHVCACFEAVKRLTRLCNGAKASLVALFQICADSVLCLRWSAVCVRTSSLGF